MMQTDFIIHTCAMHISLLCIQSFIYYNEHILAHGMYWGISAPAQNFFKIGS